MFDLHLVEEATGGITKSPSIDADFKKDPGGDLKGEPPSGLAVEEEFHRFTVRHEFHPMAFGIGVGGQGREHETTPGRIDPGGSGGIDVDPPVRVALRVVGEEHVL